ncbi:MAG TPA: carboxypeptidase regulatory-like domain-containing protein [Pyrinomonadaceae bacterium]
MLTKSYLAAAVLSLLLIGGGAPVAAQSESRGWLLVEVTDTNGQPLRDACVTFVPKEGEILFRKADARGRVKLKGATAAKYRVVVKVEGYEAQKREVTVEEKMERVVFSLQPREGR